MRKQIAPANMKCQISMLLCCLLGWFAMPTKNSSMLDPKQYVWKALKKINMQWQSTIHSQHINHTIRIKNLLPLQGYQRFYDSCRRFNVMCSFQNIFTNCKDFLSLNWSILAVEWFQGHFLAYWECSGLKIPRMASFSQRCFLQQRHKNKFPFYVVVWSSIDAGTWDMGHKILSFTMG